VKRALEKYNIHHYLPLLVQKRPWSDRIKTIYTPLFPGYLFVNVNPQMEEYWKVCTTPGVSKILGDSAGPAVIPEEQILDIQKLLSRDQPLYTIRGIQSGQSAMVVAGPLQGIRGIFVQKKEKEYLVLHIKILGHSIIAEVKQQDVEIIHPANHVACTK
jgi:transcription antitermination factor NusG